jgi:hypothetical protein
MLTDSSRKLNTGNCPLKIVCIVLHPQREA